MPVNLFFFFNLTLIFSFLNLNILVELKLMVFK